MGEGLKEWKIYSGDVWVWATRSLGLKTWAPARILQWGLTYALIFYCLLMSWPVAPLIKCDVAGASFKLQPGSAPSSIPQRHKPPLCISPLKLLRQNVTRFLGWPTPQVCSLMTLWGTNIATKSVTRKQGVLLYTVVKTKSYIFPVNIATKWLFHKIHFVPLVTGVWCILKGGNRIMEFFQMVCITFPEPNKGQPVHDVHSTGETWPPHHPPNTPHITINFIDLKIGIYVQKLLILKAFSFYLRMTFSAA